MTVLLQGYRLLALAINLWTFPLGPLYYGLQDYSKDDIVEPIMFNQGYAVKWVANYRKSVKL